jgi:hypothetical protein
MENKTNIIFYIILLLSLVIFLLPPEYKVAGYSLNFLGWIWLLFLIPSTLFFFSWLSIVDLKKKNIKQFIIRLVFFTITLIITVIILIT